MVWQAVIFNKHMYTTQESRDWLRAHDIRPIKRVHETANYYRYRLARPKRNGTYYTIQPRDGIHIIVEK